MNTGHHQEEVPPECQGGRGLGRGQNGLCQGPRLLSGGAETAAPQGPPQPWAQPSEHPRAEALRGQCQGSEVNPTLLCTVLVWSGGCTWSACAKELGERHLGLQEETLSGEQRSASRVPSPRVCGHSPLRCQPSLRQQGQLPGLQGHRLLMPGTGHHHSSAPSAGTDREEGGPARGHSGDLHSPGTHSPRRARQKIRNQGGRDALCVVSVSSASVLPGSCPGPAHPSQPHAL